MAKAIASPAAIRLRKQIRNWIIFFIAAIWLSGITAFPLEAELGWLSRHSGFLPEYLAHWVQLVYEGIRHTNADYPFISYGTDWLAFAHIIIGLLFIGLLKDPLKNRWIVDWGIICCLLVFPLALFAGPVRHIPLFHQVIDCLFGALGLVPLVSVRNKIILLDKAEATKGI
jgi:hypothetical protein